MKKVIAWTEPTVFNQDITELIENHYDCLPVKLSQNKHEDLKEILDLVKESKGGVILAGGNDIWPGTIGLQLERGDNLSKFDILRDKREIFAIDYCIENNVPVLAVCRGFQIVLSYVYGLPLIQDISGYPILHSPSADDIKLNSDKGEYLHWVTCFPEYHDEFFMREWVTSFHHQAIHFSPKMYKENKYKQQGLEVIGIADLNTDLSDKGNKKRDIIELARGIEHKILAVQGHPEAGQDYLRNPASKVIVDKFAEMLNL